MNKEIKSACTLLSCSTLLAILVILVMSLAGCERKHVRHYKVLPKTEVVTVFRIHSKTNMLAESNPSNNWMYAYVITDSQRHYYRAMAPTQTKSYSTLNWSRVVANTIQEVLESLPDTDLTYIDTSSSSSLSALVPVEENVVQTEELGMAVEQEIAIDIPEVNSLDSMEGVPEGSVEVDSGSMDSSSADSSSGDSSSGDSSGGDSGGGDGGGGDGGGD